MSTPSNTGSPGLLAVRGLPAAWIMAAAAFAGFSMLVPVVPLAIARAGGGDTLAGAVTGVFMAATVVTQPLVPRALRRYGPRPVLTVGCLLLGLPSLLFLVSVAAVPVLLVSAVRGIGFGVVTVAGAALVGRLAPPRLLGRATGAHGIAIAGAQMIGFPAGLTLAETVGVDAVFVVGALVPTLALLGIVRIPDVRGGSSPTSSGGGVRSLVWPAGCVAAGATAYGGISSLLPIAVPAAATAAGVLLAIMSAATLVGRFGAGILADRIGAGRLLPVALGVAVVAVLPFAGAAAEIGPATVWLVVGVVVFGAAFGAIQNESLLVAFRRAGPNVGAGSAAWNMGFDAGSGAGAFALGAFATAWGYPWAFVVAATLVAIVPVAARAVAGPEPGDDAPVPRTETA